VLENVRAKNNVESRVLESQSGDVFLLHGRGVADVNTQVIDVLITLEEFRQPLFRGEVKQSGSFASIQHLFQIQVKRSVPRLGATGGAQRIPIDVPEATVEVMKSVSFPIADVALHQSFSAEKVV
jgi:hypothetical protein